MGNFWILLNVILFNIFFFGHIQFLFLGLFVCFCFQYYSLKTFSQFFRLWSSCCSLPNTSPRSDHLYSNSNWSRVRVDVGAFLPTLNQELFLTASDSNVQSHHTKGNMLIQVYLYKEIRLHFMAYQPLYVI